MQSKYFMQVWQVETQKFDFMTLDSRCSNCFRQILRISEIQICLYVYVFNSILPFQKRKQYHILRLLEDRFSPRTQSTPGAGTLIQILQKIIFKLSLSQTNNCG